MNNEIEVKIDRLVRFLKEENFGGVLLNAQHNFAWLTGGASNGIDLSRENGVASIFVRSDGNRFLIANNIEMSRLLEEEVSADIFKPVEFSWQDEKASPVVPVELARGLAKGREVVTDLQFGAGVRVAEAQVASCRYQLTSEEINRYRAVGSDAGQALGNLIGKIAPGESELAIADKLRFELSLYGLASVVTLVAADEKIAKFRHPVPTPTRWQKTLLLVTCAKRQGLVVSISRLVCVGEIPEELKKKTDAAALVNVSLLSMTTPGISGAELYRIAAAAYEESGFGDEINKHHQGGATGYKTREWVMHPKNTEVVNLDQAFAWNPSITGTKIEDTVLVTQNGVETITTTPGFPIIATRIEGREFRSAGILSI